ncbi:carboxypeptidase-like regulatory domain-containing protein [Mucilaginibacter sp. dw_454]|uniref:carboxypeptidase regulatory-like domain-containing protein n=1 Tax=Mucilaginibacter sp. dw_454 TaxID=2720079 RepID=UPI001BD264FE|nr:carboxypeptidase-like regulatory domain-containing protein [Mucilaginibacter sp. dw_454]
MKQLYLALSFCILVLSGFTASAQNKYNITGTVEDEKGQPLKSATVFLSQSQSITISDDAGRFGFSQMDQGSYRLIVTMIGYAPYTQDFTLRDKSTDFKVILKLKHIELKPVNVGGKDHWNDQYELFRQAFLGTSINGKYCIIKNPTTVYFSTRKDTLIANADDFLVIENPRLGYRIKYLLKYFTYNYKSRIALYDGEISFEPMTGMPKQQTDWDEHRLDAYQGSFMHWLRSVYHHNTAAEGFVVNPVYRDYKFFNMQTAEAIRAVDIDYRPVNFDTVAHVVNSSFVALKFNSFFVYYNPKRAASPRKDTVAVKRSDVIDKTTSLVKLYGKETLIDSKGAHSDFRDFLLDGQFGHNRLGDQLPFEYQPPETH